MPGMLLLALGLYAITLQRRSSDASRLIQSDRFYTLVLMYSLFSLKTVMDRSDNIGTSWTALRCYSCLSCLTV